MITHSEVITQQNEASITAVPMPAQPVNRKNIALVVHDQPQSSWHLVTSLRKVKTPDIELICSSSATNVKGTLSDLGVNLLILNIEQNGAFELLKEATVNNIRVIATIGDFPQAKVAVRILKLPHIVEPFIEEHVQEVVAAYLH